MHEAGMMNLLHRPSGVLMGSVWCRYVDDEGVVTLKGQVAAEIQSADELVLCELVFQGGLRVCAPLYSPLWLDILLSPDHHLSCTACVVLL